MSLFDLKPLNEATIQELGLEPHELWLLKIGDQTFGPFETLSLRHYAYDNLSDFDGAFASHVEVEDWVYFANIEEFKDIFAPPAAVIEEDKPEQYWILNQGIISKPLAYKDIEKRMEMGILSLTDAISVDEGETWHKIFELNAFAHKLHSSKELPVCPKESQFQEARVRILEKIEAKAQLVSDNASSLAFLGQKTTQIVILKVDEIQLSTPLEYEVSSSMKWAIPSAAVAMLTLVMSGYFYFGKTDESALITENDFQLKRSISGSRSGAMDGQNQQMNRRPTSTPSFRSQRSNVTRNGYQESSYPTHIETHQQDPQNEPMFDDPPQSPQTEESLLAAQNPGGDPNNLDAAMSGPQPAEPALESAQVEEISDF